MQPIWGLSGSWHLGMMLLILAFWGVAIAGVVLSIRWLRIQGRRPQSDAALEALRRRRGPCLDRAKKETGHE